MAHLAMEAVVHELQGGEPKDLFLGDVVRKDARKLVRLGALQHASQDAKAACRWGRL